MKNSTDFVKIDGKWNHNLIYNKVNSGYRAFVTRRYNKKENYYIS